jgi:ABC-type uncharacterized transport system involved in gliding motility auxiliary subunit
MELTRLLPTLGIVGGVLAVIGLLLPLFVHHAEWMVTILEVTALLCLGIYLSAHFQSLKAFSARRSTRLGFNSILGVILAIGIVVIINFLGARHAPQWDLSETQYFTLARQTYQVLRELPRDVTIKVFAHQGSPAFRAFRDLLMTYSGESSKVSVEFIDPDRQPDLARTYGITRIDTAVLESGDQKVYLTQASEAEMTNALLRVTRDIKKQLVFLAGHGERSVSDQQPPGFFRARDLLMKQGYQVETRALSGKDTLPENTEVLILVSPQRPIPQEVQTRITRFVKSGGRLLLLIDPQDTEVLDLFVAQWGISLGKGIVIDKRDRLGRGSPTALLIRTFTTHDITEDFTVPILFPVARYIDFQAEQAPDWEFVSLATSSPESWAETNLTDTVPKLNPGEDVEGPLTIAGTLTPKTPSEKPDRDPAVVIVGNSAFASNAYLNYPGNTDFFLKTIAWLAKEGQLVSIPPKEPAFRPFVPNPSQEKALLFFQVLFLPGFTLFLGYSVWRRRRRL